MDRTIRAAALADVIGLVMVTGVGRLMGFEWVPSLVAGAVVGTAFVVLILLAARRAESMAPPDEGEPHG